MDVYDAKTARELAASWRSHGKRGARLLDQFADDQMVCARLARDLGRVGEALDHEAAARELVVIAAAMTA